MRIFPVIVLLVAVAGNARADELTEFGGQHDAGSVQMVDHTLWDRLLHTYISEQQGLHYFAYGEVSARDAAALASYIAMLEGVVVSGLAPDEQFAFWVNLYNAVTVKVILEHYPLRSIRDISFGFFSRGPWSEPLTMVEGRGLSLDDIEHKILRPVFADARIHYVVNCASIGCPNLPQNALFSAALDAQLDHAAVQFINHPRAVRVADGRLVLSKIYDWYGDDFGANETQLIAHLREFALPDLQAALDTVDEVDDFEYDWSLNELSDDSSAAAAVDN